MEDAATAEISRAQVWQWIRRPVTLIDGRVMTSALYLSFVQEEMQKIRALVGEAQYLGGKFESARALFDDLVMKDAFPEFLTLKAYDQLEDA